MFEVPDNFEKDKEELDSLRKEFQDSLEKIIKELFQFENDWFSACSRLVDPREIPELKVIYYGSGLNKASIFHKEKLLGTFDLMNQTATINNVPFYGETDKRRKG